MTLMDLVYNWKIKFLAWNDHPEEVLNLVDFIIEKMEEISEARIFKTVSEFDMYIYDDRVGFPYYDDIVVEIRIDNPKKHLFKMICFCVLKNSQIEKIDISYDYGKWWHEDSWENIKSIIFKTDLKYAFNIDNILKRIERQRIRCGNV